jgi:uncharacterized phage-like protein YoqJ
LPESKSCCFTGHRPDKLYGYDPMSPGNRKMLFELKDVIRDHIENRKVDTFITGMALGIDIWAARLVLSLRKEYPKLRLIAAVPCYKQESKWPKTSQEEWQMIINQCDEVHYIHDGDYTPWCMQKRNEWMVDNSDYVIAVHDGSKGGTMNCIKYAEKKNKSITKMKP